MSRFYISGCQRSGTTMLRLVLESHSAIQCFDEAMGYELLIKETKGEVVDYSRKLGAILLGFKIPRFAEQLTRSEFNDPDYGQFSSFYKDQKVVHVFRDTLDVICSMIRLKADGDVSWLDKYGRIILQSMIADQTPDSIYRKKYADVEQMGLPAHLVGALYWEIKNQGFFDLRNLNKPVHPIRYEALVASPREELLKLCQFLDVEWSDELLNHPVHPHAELDEKGKAIGETDPRRSIDTSSIGVNRDLLTDKQIREIQSFVGDMSCQIDSLLTT